MIAAHNSIGRSVLAAQFCAANLTLPNELVSVI
jgi:hypothetical protein